MEAIKGNSSITNDVNNERVCYSSIVIENIILPIYFDTIQISERTAQIKIIVIPTKCRDAQSWGIQNQTICISQHVVRSNARTWGRQTPTESVSEHVGRRDRKSVV